MKLSRRTLVWLSVSSVGACRHEAGTGDSITSPSDMTLQCVSVSPESVKAFVGDTLKFTLSPCRFVARSDYRWSTGNSAIADVDSLTGLVRAKSVGGTMIIATHAQNRSVKGAAVVEVSARP